MWSGSKSEGSPWDKAACWGLVKSEPDVLSAIQYSTRPLIYPFFQVPPMSSSELFRFRIRAQISADCAFHQPIVHISASELNRCSAVAAEYLRCHASVTDDQLNRLLSTHRKNIARQKTRPLPLEQANAPSSVTAPVQTLAARITGVFASCLACLSKSGGIYVQ